MRKAVLFDLGNTLVQYYEPSEFPSILTQAIIKVRSCLLEQGLPCDSLDALWPRVDAENHEAEDHRVRPLEGRLARIFRLDLDQTADLLESVCRCFLQPIFARGRCYPDTLPVLRKLKCGGYRTALVSNAPWGSPAWLWREELARLGLAEWLDAAAFCTDVGWRKPARPIFQFALEQLRLGRHDCLFVGDDPRWDLAGPQALGIEAILIDRQGACSDPATRVIHSLHELWDV
jgi:putative hydrolase of the HAD superfamily